VLVCLSDLSLEASLVGSACREEISKTGAKAKQKAKSDASSDESQKLMGISRSCDRIMSSRFVCRGEEVDGQHQDITLEIVYFVEMRFW